MSLSTKRKPAESTKNRPVRIFVSYCHKDEAWQAQLQVHLAPLIRDDVAIWFDGDITPGEVLDTEIARKLREADIFVALLTPDYIHSNYCWNIEFRRAMSRRARGLVRVVAVVVRPCSWPQTRAARFKLLPKDARPVNNWRSADEALVNVAAGLRAVVAEVRKDVGAVPRRRAKETTTSAKAGPKPTVPTRSKPTRRAPASRPKRKPVSRPK